MQKYFKETDSVVERIRTRANSVQGGRIQGEMVYQQDVYRVQQVIQLGYLSCATF